MHSLVASMAEHTKGYNKKRHQAMLNIVGVNILRVSCSDGKYQRCFPFSLCGYSGRCWFLPTFGGTV